MIRFYLKTFGCQVNFNDSEKLSEVLLKLNYKKSETSKKSNIIIINSCSIRNKSFKKIFNYLNNFRNKKLIILTGCIPILYNKILFKLGVNIILNTYNIHKIKYLINMYYKNKCNQVSINFIKFNNDFKKNILLKKTSYINIIEGCNKYCSYCIVPYTRGPEVSKFLIHIINEIYNLNKEYKSEIYLIGQNVNSYFGRLKQNSKKFIKFYNLLNYINQFYYVNLINFITSHIKDFNDKIINQYKNIYKIKKNLHLPIQSCSDKILLLMKRNYKLINYKRILNRIKNFNINFNITTDIIIGFPQETKLDFNKTIIFIEKFLFDKSYIFLYNPRPYTKASYYIDNNNKSIKLRRFFIIKNKIKNNIYYINKNMIGKIEIIFVKNKYINYNNVYIGNTNNNRFVIFEFNNSYNLIGKFIKVKILDFKLNLFYSKIYDL